MANIEQLADSVMRRKQNAASHVGMTLLVEQAIRGAGITNLSDIKRLKPQVLSALGKRSGLKSAIKAARRRPNRGYVGG